MIDLSYLTDEEQGKIKAVLKRDTKLKNFEEQRIKKLHKSEKDINRLKYLTGEWFYETKYNRHRDKIHGSDIIRASMGLRKPVTILELTQSWNENTSFVNREKKDVFIPPELVGLIEEPSSQSRNDRVNDHRSTEAQHERQRPEIKPRQNPFNSFNSQRDADRRINGVNEAEKTPTEDHHELCDEPQSTQVSNSQPNAEPTGKAIEIINECQTHKFTEEEGSSISKVLEWLRGSRDGTLTIPAQGEKNQEDPKVHSTSDTKSGDLENSEQQKTKPLPKSRRGLFALFSRVEKKDKICEALVSDEEAKSREYFTGELKPEAGDCLGLQDENKKTKILQVTPKEENGNKAGPACEDGSQKEFKSEISTGRLANLKSFWERGNKGHKILSIRKGDDMQECEPSPLYGKDCNALDSNVRLLKSSDPIPNPVCTSEYSVDVESNTSDMSALSSNENGKSYDLDRIQMSKDPITKQEINLIKTDAQLVSSSPLLKHTKNTTDYKLEEDVLAESLSREISNQQKESSTFEMFLSQQENRVLINDLKSCWEKEKSSLVPVCSPTHQESSSHKSRIELDNPDLKHSLDQGMLSSDNEDGLVLQEDNMEMNKEKSQNPEVEQDPQDVRGDSEEENPVKAALERAKTRPISISKSLEDLASSACISAVTPNTKASFSDPEQMKMMSMSVPAFNHQEMDYRKSDCASVSSYGFDRLRTYTASSSICSEVASMSSVCSSAMSIYSTVEVKGTIQFAIHYLQKLREFHIFVVQCKHLAMADPKRNRSDPYVKCYLLPDKAKYGKRKTCVRKKTLDPTYNEILRFKIPMETLRTQKLNLSVWHNDKFGHNSFLGEVEIDLSEWDFNNTQTNEYLLKGRVPSSPKHSACSQETRAKMRVALRFQSQTSDSHKHKGNGEVQIWVKECKNLPISRGVSIDPFVKCTLLPDSSRKKRQKTRVLKKTSNPEFDHIMVYEGFKAEDLKEACTELTVWDHDRLHNHFIGGIRLGPGTGKSYGADVDWMDSNSAEASLWERMMQSHNEWVEAVLPLRMLVMAKVSR